MQKLKHSSLRLCKRYTNKTKDKKNYLYSVPETITVDGITLNTVDGDSHDARFLDNRKNCFVVLRGKGQEIRKDTTNFMRKVF